MQIGDRVRYSDTYLRNAATKCVVTPRTRALTGKIFWQVSDDEVIVQWWDGFATHTKVTNLALVQP